MEYPFYEPAAGDRKDRRIERDWLLSVLLRRPTGQCGQAAAGHRRRGLGLDFSNMR